MPYSPHGKKNKTTAIPYLACIVCLSFLLLFPRGSYLQDIGNTKETGEKDSISEKKQPKSVRRKFLKKLPERDWYNPREKQKKKRVDISSIQNDTDLSSLKKSAQEGVDSIIVLLGEIPLDGGKVLPAPVFLMDKENVWGSRSDLSLKWLGYKITATMKQKNFPWKNTVLKETLVGSFLYASGTNLGFYGSQIKEERRFYTNYSSQILSLKIRAPLRTYIEFTLDSRQYFFVERDVPDSFIMPKDHVNLFPRIDIGLEKLTEKGIDQLTQGVGIKIWGGYGIRNRWDRWGEYPNYETGVRARTFAIVSGSITAGALFHDHHNAVIRIKYKGGIDNDFLSRPRFGGTIDNAKLDVVHGFPLDHFRVDSFGLVNARYGFNVFRRLRLTLFFDYAHIFEPVTDTIEDIFGAAYGIRILAWGGLPVWVSHGMGKRCTSDPADINHMLMIMTAVGW